MADDFYDNLLKATDNLQDIVFSKYAEVTKVDGNAVECKEQDTSIIHTDVPLINNLEVDVGDFVVLCFVDNSLYNPVVTGMLEPRGGGGGGSVIGTGSFSIKDDGHLWVELPRAVDNPYYINSEGHLVYDTHNPHNIIGE